MKHREIGVPLEPYANRHRVSYGGLEIAYVPHPVEFVRHHTCACLSVFHNKSMQGVVHRVSINNLGADLIRFAFLNANQRSLANVAAPGLQFVGFVFVALQSTDVGLVHLRP